MASSRARLSAVPSTVANPSRLANLANTGLLDSPIEEAFERLTRLAARTIHAPVSLVSLVDRERQFFKSAFGLPEPWLSKRETPLTHSFCKHLVETAKPLLIEDARAHPLVKDSLAISDLGVIAYAGMPLILKNKQCIGSFCVIDHVPRVWRDEELALLRDLAASVMAEIELRLLMSAKEELLDVIFHDLKNPLGAISLNAQILQRKAVVLGNGPIAKATGAIRFGTERMSDIIQDLSDLHRMECRELALEFGSWDPSEILKSAMTMVRPFADQRHVQIRTRLDVGGQVRCDGMRVAQAIAKLVMLSVKRSSEGQEITVTATRTSAALEVNVQDAGAPLLQEDVVHFFDRFVQSPAFPSKGAKLSVCLAYEIIRAHDGAVEVKPRDHLGNRIEMILPSQG